MDSNQELKVLRDYKDSRSPKQVLESIDNLNSKIASIGSRIQDSLNKVQAPIIKAHDQINRIGILISETEKSLKRNLDNINQSISLDNERSFFVVVRDKGIDYKESESNLEDLVIKFFDSMQSENEYNVALEDIEYLYLKNQFEIALSKLDKVKKCYSKYKKDYYRSRYKKLIINIRSVIRRKILFSFKKMDDVSGERKIVKRQYLRIDYNYLNFLKHEIFRKKTNYRLIT